MKRNFEVIEVDKKKKIITIAPIKIKKRKIKK